MTSGRTVRPARRPRTYGAMVLAVAAILAAGVAGTWRLAHETRVAPADLASN
jgi:hypothetical protein